MQIAIRHEALEKITNEPHRHGTSIETEAKVRMCERDARKSNCIAHTTYTLSGARKRLNESKISDRKKVYASVTRNLK